MTDLRSFDEESWRPVIFDTAKPEERAALQALRANQPIWQTHDVLARQVHELARIRMPGATEDMVAQAAGRVLAGEHYGRWVHYPWSGRLLHLLPPEDFQSLRLSRNLYKNTPDEQARLAQLTIGVVGLSAGAAAVQALVLEGIGGHLKLADFDRLELSNLNRVRAGVHDVGQLKAVVIARQVLEIDPYLRITLYPHGITRDSVDAFLGGAAPVDVVVEECDSLAIKLLLRERARARGLPVVMETSDRGMLDVERFDLEPDRPILHGRLGSLGAHALERLPASARLAVAAQVVGAETVSTRLAASAMEIGHTITTWPQLGSEVMLGGASVTAALRRIGLGQPLVSGRRYVDLDAVLASAPEPVTAAALPRPIPEIPRSEAIARSEAVATSAPACSALARFVVAHAAMAPSGGNAQPWKFHAEGSRLWLRIDRTRAQNLLSVADRPVLLAMGAAAENIRIAATQRGHRVDMLAFPFPASHDVVAELVLAQGRDAEHAELAALVEPLRQRATNRAPGSGEVLTCLEMRRLQWAAERRGARLELALAPRALAAVAALVGESNRIRYLCDPLHQEMFGELRWSPAEARERRDGLDVATLALGPDARTMLRLAARPDVARLLRARDGGSALRGGAARTLIESASAVGVLSMACDTSADWLQAGRAMQRVWLEATRLGLGFQPVGTLIYMLHMLDAPAGAVFRPHERSTLLAQKQRMDEVFPRSSQRVPVMMFRLARAPMPAVRSLRRPVDDILLAGAPPMSAEALQLCTAPMPQAAAGRAALG